MIAKYPLAYKSSFSLKEIVMLRKRNKSQGKCAKTNFNYTKEKNLNIIGSKIRNVKPWRRDVFWRENIFNMARKSYNF